MTEEQVRAVVEAIGKGGGDTEAIVRLASGILPMLDELGALPLGMIPPATVFLPGRPGGRAAGGGRGER